MSQMVATRRLAHMAVLVALAGGFALVLGTWVPLAATVPIVAAVLWSFGECLLPLPDRARRTVLDADHLMAGDETTVRVGVRALAAPGSLLLRDDVPEAVSVVPASRTRFVRRGNALVAEYGARFDRRGQVRFHRTNIERVGALGLFRRTVVLDCPAAVQVHPSQARGLGVRVRPRPPSWSGVTTRSLRRGVGDEFFGLREYHPGDTPGDVNWKATARYDRLITNEFVPEEPPRYLVYVDTRPGTAEQGRLDAFERTLELASVLVEALIHAGAHVGLVLLSFHSVFTLPAGGAAQLRRMRGMILHAVPGHDADPYLLVQAGIPHLPQRAEAVLITADCFHPNLQAAVVLLRSRHGRVNVVFPGFPEPEGDGIEGAAAHAAGVLLNAEQGLALAGLQRMADHAAQWMPDEPIAVTLDRLGMGGRRR